MPRRPRSANRRPPSVRRRLPFVAATAIGVTALTTMLTSCGVANADRDRAEVLAATCLSTIIRNGLPAPTAEQISPDRFAAERERLLATGRRFNTVTPYRNVCNDIKDELRAAATAATTPDATVAPDGPDEGTDDGGDDS